MFRNEALDLIVLLLVSLLLSIYLFFHMHVIAMDGAFQYIPMAKIFAGGSFRDAVTYSGQQPLFAFLVSLVSPWVGDFEWAARGVSSFFGILLILPVYALGKQVFDRRVAFLSCLFLVIHPYIRRFSADALKESTYLFFFAVAIWFTVRALQRERLYLFLFIPLLSGLAYLVRPDGAELFVAVLFYTLFIKRFSASGTKIKAILILILSSGFLFLPYLLYLRGTVGAWSLSKTKSIAAFIGLGLTMDRVPLVNEILFTFRYLVEEIQARLLPLFLFLMVVGFGKTFLSRFKKEESFLVVLWILHVAVLFLLIFNLTDWDADKASETSLFSGRHVLPLLLISIYWIAEGFVKTHQWVCARATTHGFLRRVEAGRRPALLWAALLILVLAVVLPKTLKPQRYEKLPEKWAGIWIKSQSGKGATIFTTQPRVAYYADGFCEYITSEDNKQDKIRAALGEKKTLYLVIQEEVTARSLGASVAAGNDFTEVMRYEKKGMEKIIIYRRTS